MNNVLELRGKRFTQAHKPNWRGGGASMNSKEIVTIEQLNKLQIKIIEIKKFWESETKPFDGILISVYYNKIVAKSNRISGIFKGDNSNQAIVGAKFNQEKNKHIITYFLSINELENTVELLSKVQGVLDNEFNQKIDKKTFDDNITINKIQFKKYSISKSMFKQVIADVSYIENFDVDKATQQLKQSIITLYDIHVDTQKILKSIGVDILPSRILDNQTVFLDENQLKLLYDKVPYLVSMATVDLAEMTPNDFIQENQQQILFIAQPSIEPTIGVIDTLFDTRVYFNEWVEYYDMVDSEISKTPEDYRHGTAVTSIIVDGAQLNPWLDDGCGRFKVRHFGVAVGASFSSFTIIKMIREIISNNNDIKVWNISLGSNQEINDNFISAEAAILDQIQYENDVIFVVAGTNKPDDTIVKIGSPADSINSVVVNAVTRSGLLTEYGRKGLALSFFAKPDVSYYGGSKEEYIRVCEPLGEARVAGTSFAAPWIARKLSYLIDVLGLNREIAKAVIIDAARGWNERPTLEEIAIYGHGIVPIKMSDIIQTKEDEIKFLVSDVSEKWNTYNYHFPIPLENNKYPYIARATMCYFPICDKFQGVDYTCTELNIHFGRINNNEKIKDIKGDTQNQEETPNTEKHYLLEWEARDRFRKWDNVKYVTEQPKDKMYPRKSYNNKNWGMEIKTNNRLNPDDGIGIRFGVVVTIKEINGINRIDDFIKNCTLNGWIVSELDVISRVRINKTINENIEFD